MTMESTIANVLRVGVAAIVLAVAVPVQAQTPATLAAADRLIVAQGFELMLKDMAQNITSNMAGASPAQKQAFVGEMTSPAFVERFRATTRVAMAKHMSVEELDALTEFYSRPVAKSAMAKMGTYMADVMTFVQAEVPAMVQRIQQQK